MSVQEFHPLYIKRYDQWETIRDCVEGENAIKNKKEKYLPAVEGMDKKQYAKFQKRARFINYVGRTLDSLHGMIFRREPIVDCSENFRKTGILENIDRRGTSLYQFVADTVYDNMQTQWGGYLADFPQTNGPISKLEAEEENIKPYLRYYPAESVTNWRYGVINGTEQLCLVVLKEDSDIPVGDEFSHVVSTTYRVLDICDGKYRQRVFVTSGKKDVKGNLLYDVIELPFICNGESESEIPFYTVPSKLPEKPMFMDLAYANIGHYQKSADYENGVHLTTIPTGYVTGHRPIKDPESGENEVIHLGGDSFLVFEEENAKVGTLVFSGEGLTHSETALTQAAADMMALGTMLIVSNKTASESSESAKIHRAGENAVLATYAKNISTKLTQALRKMAHWAEVDENLTVELCTDYDTMAFDPNALNALANLAEAGKLPMPYVYECLRAGEYASPKSDYEEYATAIQMEKMGYSPIEVYDYIKAKRMGQPVNLKLENKTLNTPISTPKEEEETEE